MSLHSNIKKYRKEKNKWKVETLEEYEQREIELQKELMPEKIQNIPITVRITAGKAKNIQIEVPTKTRPLTDRMKTRLFDLLAQDIANKTVLDLYAGSGSFGLEALSRGAKEAIFVDASKSAEKLLMNNVRRTGFLTETTIIKSKVEKFLDDEIESKAKFEIIFMDPPYKYYNTKDLSKIQIILSKVKQMLPGYGGEKTKLFKGALIVKHPRKYPITKLKADGLKIVDQYNFGLNTITIYIVEL